MLHCSILEGVLFVLVEAPTGEGLAASGTASGRTPIGRQRWPLHALRCRAGPECLRSLRPSPPAPRLGCSGGGGRRCLLLSAPSFEDAWYCRPFEFAARVGVHALQVLIASSSLHWSFLHWAATHRVSPGSHGVAGFSSALGFCSPLVFTILVLALRPSSPCPGL